MRPASLAPRAARGGLDAPRRSNGRGAQPPHGRAVVSAAALPREHDVIWTRGARLRWRFGLLVQGVRLARRTARAAQAQSGKSIPVQAREIIALRPLRLGPREYYKYRLFDGSRCSAAERREYVGKRFEDVFRIVNDPGLLAVSNVRGSWEGRVDKILFDSLMRAADVPTPPIIALFDTAGASYYGVPALRTSEALEQFVRSRADSGFFAKPARAHRGEGAIAVARVEDGTVSYPDGTRHPLGELLAAIAAHKRVVFQERLVPHPRLQAIWGATIGTVRVITLRRDRGSLIHRTVLRIPVGNRITDNFGIDGRSGILIGWVEPATGKLLKVVAGRGVDQRVVERHPDTDASLVGLVLPDWPEAIALLERASQTLVAMPLQAWDLALTDRGPVIVEVNDISGQNILQLAGPPGLLDRELCDFLRERGVDWPYPHPAAAAPEPARGAARV